MRHCVLYFLFVVLLCSCSHADRGSAVDDQVSTVVPEVAPKKEVRADRISLDPNVKWVSDTTEASIPSNVVDLSETLKHLHRTTLTAFESAPNFGYLRMPGYMRESSPPRHVPLLATVSKSYSSKERKPNPGEPAPSEAWIWLKNLTGVCAKGFVYQPNKCRRGQKVPQAIDRLVCGYPTPNAQSFVDFVDELTDVPRHLNLWRVASLELIGLWQRPTGLVFEHRPPKVKGFQTEGEIRRLQTRKVNRQESVALSKLRAQAQLVATFDADTSNIRLVGAIRATTACLKCHDTQAGSLLGAFTYRLERIPEPEKLVGSRIPAQEIAFPWIRKVKGTVNVDDKNRALGIYLHSDRVTDADLARLKGLTTLQSVQLVNTSVTGVGFKHLKELPHLRSLDLSKLNSDFSDAGLSHLTVLKRLKELDLGHTSVTDTGLAHLKKLPNLEKLVLFHCKITDAGLSHLTDLKNLRRLDLCGTRVTVAGFEKLQAALPQCEIRRP